MEEMSCFLLSPPPLNRHFATDSVVNLSYTNETDSAEFYFLQKIIIPHIIFILMGVIFSGLYCCHPHPHDPYKAARSGQYVNMYHRNCASPTVVSALYWNDTNCVSTHRLSCIRAVVLEILNFKDLSNSERVNMGLNGPVSVRLFVHGTLSYWPVMVLLDPLKELWGALEQPHFDHHCFRA